MGITRDGLKKVLSLSELSSSRLSTISIQYKTSIDWTESAVDEGVTRSKQVSKLAMFEPSLSNKTRKKRFLCVNDLIG